MEHQGERAEILYYGILLNIELEKIIMDYGFSGTN